MTYENAQGASLEKLLRDELQRMGFTLKAAGAQLKAETAASLLRLGAAAGQPGFMEAARAEGRVLAVIAAEELVTEADEADAALTDLVTGFLFGAARVTGTVTL